MSRVLPSTPRPHTRRIVAHYLGAGPDELRDMLHAFSDATVGLVGHRAPSLAAAQTMARSGTLQMVVTAYDEESDEFVGAWPLAAVFGIPVLVVATRALSSERVEKLRRRGVSHIVVSPLEKERDGEVVDALARSSSWMTASVRRFPLADVLQTMASHRQSGMIYVSEGAPTLIAHEAKLDDSDFGYGRLYVQAGQLTHAETAKATGIAAVAEMLAMHDATFCLHEVFLVPAERSITAALTTVLLHAAWRSDESDRRDDEPKSSLPPPTTWNPPAVVPTLPDLTSVSAGNVESGGAVSAVMSVATLKAAPPAAAPVRVQSKAELLIDQIADLRIAAKADTLGNVVESARASSETESAAKETSGEGHDAAESLCASAALVRVPLETAGDLMGLGSAVGFTAAGETFTVYVREVPRGFVAVLGEPTKNVESTYRKVGEILGK